MRKVFWDNPYQTMLNTTVALVLGNRILLEETIIFSFSGGQESDEATINGHQVMASEIEGHNIYYFLEEGHGLQTGDKVNIQINGARRHRLMRLHFAAELVLEIVSRKYHLDKIGAHIAENKARIDFLCQGNIVHHFEEVLLEYNDIIKQDYPIKTGFSDVKTQKRYWEISGFSKVACGGTHVKSTGEVGFIILKRKNIGQGKERIEITLEKDSILDFM